MLTLPLFPLNTVLFPRTGLSLHIFEPRYRMLVQICLRDEQPFGVALIRQGLEAGGPPAAPYSTGCTARILQMEPLEGGRMNIITRGEERFRIRTLDHSLPYLTGEVEYLPPPTLARPNLTGLPGLVRAYFRKLAALLLTPPTAEALQLPDAPLDRLYTAAALLHLPPLEKQPLLEAANGDELQAQVLRLYHREIALIDPLHAQDEDHRRTAWLN